MKKIVYENNFTEIFFSLYLCGFEYSGNVRDKTFYKKATNLKMHLKKLDSKHFSQNRKWFLLSTVYLCVFNYFNRNPDKMGFCPPSWKKKRHNILTKVFHLAKWRSTIYKESFYGNRSCTFQNKKLNFFYRIP